MNDSSPAATDRLDQDRASVLSWLHAAPHATPPLDSSSDHETVAHRFLERARAAGFQWEIVEIADNGHPAYEVHWTHQGSTFVGFKQPPPAHTLTGALLAGCAALLENEWCRARLPE